MAYLADKLWLLKNEVPKEPSEALSKYTGILEERKKLFHSSPDFRKILIAAQETDWRLCVLCLLLEPGCLKGNDSIRAQWIDPEIQESLKAIWKTFGLLRRQQRRSTAKTLRTQVVTSAQILDIQHSSPNPCAQESAIDDNQKSRPTLENIGAQRNSISLPATAVVLADNNCTQTSGKRLEDSVDLNKKMEESRLRGKMQVDDILCKDTNQNSTPVLVLNVPNVPVDQKADTSRSDRRGLAAPKPSHRNFFPNACSKLSEAGRIHERDLRVVLQHIHQDRRCGASKRHLACPRERSLRYKRHCQKILHG